MLSDADLLLAFDLAPVGLCVSRKRVIQRCNEAYASMFGYIPDELVGQSLSILYPSTEEFERIGERGIVVMHNSGRYSDICGALNSRIVAAQCLVAPSEAGSRFEPAWRCPCGPAAQHHVHATVCSPIGAANPRWVHVQVRGTRALYAGKFVQVSAAGS